MSDYSLGRMETVFRDSDDDLGITRSMTEAAPLHPEVERPLARTPPLPAIIVVGYGAHFATVIPNT